MRAILFFFFFFLFFSIIVVRPELTHFVLFRVLVAWRSWDGFTLLRALRLRWKDSEWNRSFGFERGCAVLSRKCGT